MVTRTIQKSEKTAEVTTEIKFWHQRRPVNIQRCSSSRVYRSDPSSRNYTPRPSHPSFRHSLPPHTLDTMLHRHHQSTSFYYKSTFVLSATASGVSTIPSPPPVPPPPLPTRHLPRRAGRCSTSSTRAVPSTATSICAHRPTGYSNPCADPTTMATTMYSWRDACSETSSSPFSPPVQG